MTIICINAIILYWVPNSSQVRASKTVLQIILKLMIKAYHQKLHIMHYNHLILSLLPFFLWVYFHRCSSQSTLEMTYLWYSYHMAHPAKEKKKKKILFSQIDFLNQFTAGWHKPDATKRGRRKKLQQSWLGANWQILWTTLNCSFSKQTYRRVKKNHHPTMKLIATSLRTIWIRKTSGFPKHQYFKYKCTLLPFYTGSELNFITGFMAGRCGPERKAT